MTGIRWSSWRMLPPFQLSSELLDWNPHEVHERALRFYSARQPPPSATFSNRRLHRSKVGIGFGRFEEIQELLTHELFEGCLRSETRIHPAAGALRGVQLSSELLDWYAFDKRRLTVAYLDTIPRYPNPLALEERQTCQNSSPPAL